MRLPRLAVPQGWQVRYRSSGKSGRVWAQFRWEVPDACDLEVGSPRGVLMPPTRPTAPRPALTPFWLPILAYPADSRGCAARA